MVEDRKEQEFRLPSVIVTRADVGRLVSEAEALDEQMRAAAIRTPGNETKLPNIGAVFNEFLELNKLNVLHEKDRTKLRKFLQDVRLDAPILHIGFGTEPSPAFLQKLTAWIREQIHPLTLLQVGLHPSIGAGCVLRTTNKYYDFSLRQRFAKNRQLLVDVLKGNSTAKNQPHKASAAE